MLKKIVVLLVCMACMACMLVGAGAEEPLIKNGDYNADVVALHEKLSELGIFTLRVESPYGPKSEDAVKVLQAALGLEVTGVISSEEELNEIFTTKLKEGTNLATDTENSITVSPTGSDTWCSPIGFYKTSEDGMHYLADEENAFFIVAFDWSVLNADTAVELRIALRDQESSHYGTVGSFRVNVGDSNGHCLAFFSATEGMRAYGQGWLMSGVGESNREIQIEISNFRFMRAIECFEVGD